MRPPNYWGMSSIPNVIAPPGVRSKSKTVAGEIWSIARTFLRVMAGYLLLVAGITAVRFPYHTDAIGPRVAPTNGEDFYARIYASPKSSQPALKNVEPDSDYVLEAKSAIQF